MDKKIEEIAREHNVSPALARAAAFTGAFLGWCFIGVACLAGAAFLGLAFKLFADWMRG